MCDHSLNYGEDCGNCKRLNDEVAMWKKAAEHHQESSKYVAARLKETELQLTAIKDLATHYTGSLWPREVNAAAGEILKLIR